MPDDKAITSDDLNSKRYLGALLSVRIKVLKEPEPAHPNPELQEIAGYSLVTYIGKNFGVQEHEGAQVLLLETTKGELTRVGLPLEAIDDISFYVEAPVASFPVAGLEKYSK